MKLENLIDEVSELDDKQFSDLISSVMFRKKGSQASIQSMTSAMVEACNGSGRTVSECLTQALIHTHPTIRQSFVRSFCNAMSRWVSIWRSGRWQPDARDEASYRFAEKIAADDKLVFPLI